MNLIKKLGTIRNPQICKSIGLLTKGSANSVDEFFETFVLPKLPKPEVIKKWHTLLMEYVSDLNNLSCAVRYGNSGSNSASKSGETGYKKLRRGWLTKNIDDNFEYFYADNYLTSFIYKMAIDGYCPTLQSFKDTFLTHKFPYGFNFHHDKKYEAEGTIIPYGKEPGFLGNYKISHIFNTGEFYIVDGKKYSTIKMLSEDYFDIGSRDQWLKESDKIRKLNITETEKKVITASFLRFVHPLNYFLTPTRKKHKCTPAVQYNDIGEYDPLVEKVKEYIKNTYPKEYAEFTEKIMWYDGSNSTKGLPKDIHIEYGPDITSSSSKSKHSSKSVSTSSKDFSLYEFNGMVLNKRRLAFEVIKQAIIDKKIKGYSELINAFADVGLKKRNFIKLIDISDKSRWITSYELILDGIQFAVSNQWTKETIESFIERANNKFSYSIKKR